MFYLFFNIGEMYRHINSNNYGWVAYDGTTSCFIQVNDVIIVTKEINKNNNIEVLHLGTVKLVYVGYSLNLLQSRWKKIS